MFRLSLFVTLLVAVLATTASAFGPKPAATKNTPAPTFNKATQKWEKAAQDNGENPYDNVGALLRHGPAPFLARTFNADTYEQGVLKYMAVAKVGRAEAVGNMDAQLNNAADWAYQKMEESKGKPKVDYTRLDKKQAVLTTVWALFILPTVWYVFQKTIEEIMS